MTIESALTGVAPAYAASGQVSGSGHRQRSVASGSPRADVVGPLIGVGAGKLDGSSGRGDADVKQAIEKLKQLAEAEKKIVSYSIDTDTQTTVIKFFKSGTGELVKQYPQEEVLAVKAYMSKSAGWFIHSKS